MLPLDVSEDRAASHHAWDTARAFEKKGDLRKALYFEMNAIGHGRQDAATLSAHAALATRLAADEVKKGRREVAFSLIEELELRLLSLVGTIPPESLNALLQQIDGLDQIRDRLFPPEEPGPPTPDNEDALQESVHASLLDHRNGRFSLFVPSLKDPLIERIGLVDRMLDREREERLLTPTQLSILQKYAERLGKHHQVDEIIDQVKQVMASAAEEPDARIKGALLQQAESVIRDGLLVYRSVDDDRQNRLGGVLDDLELKTAAHVKDQIRARSESILKNWTETKGAELAAVHEWKNQHPADIKASKQLDRCQSLLASMMDTQRRIEDEETRGKFDGLATELQAAITDAAQEQRRRLNEWALKWLRRATHSAGGHAGLIDDEKEIAKKLHSNISDIDPSLLSPEMSRVYSEVLEYFVGRLDAPKGKAEDFENESSRLSLLSKLATSKKKTLAEF